MHRARGPPPGSATDNSAAAAICLSEINRYRASVGAPPLAPWLDGNTCADGQAENDSKSFFPHASFGRCWERAQNECPGWGGWFGEPATVIVGCLAAMWGEGPGGGHYENMRGNYSQVACGFFKNSFGAVTAVQDFR